MTLNPSRLAVFRAVARHGTFSAAASALNYSQPAVSHHVCRLEAEIGFQLFERGNRGRVRLTDAGLTLLPHAERMLSQMACAEAELDELVRKREERVRIASFATAGATVVADAIADFRRRCPDVELQLDEAEAADALRALAERRIDIAVVFDDPGHPLETGEAIEARYVHDDPLLLALPRRHRLARRAAINLADLQSDHWIQGAGDDTPCSLILHAACEELGFTPRVSFRSGNYQVVQRLVAAGVGVALVPELAIAGADPEVIIRPVQSRTPVRRIVVATRADRRPPAAVMGLVEALESTCERYRARAPSRDPMVVA